jgi:hypothetical protein
MSPILAIIVTLLWLLPLPVFGASAIGRTANYANAWPALEYESENTVAVGVHDQRSYVVDGEKSPAYVGATRAAFGNPWNMKTQSNKPLSDDIAFAVVSGFKRVGTPAEAISISFSDDHHTALQKIRSSEAKRIVLITIRQWKSDTYRRTSFFVDATIEVYDETGKELASCSTSHETMGSASGAVESSEDAARLHLNRLLNDPRVKASLQ